MVTGIANYGVFVGFYGGVKGMVPAKELPGKPRDCFDVGQVQWQDFLILVKSCRTHRSLLTIMAVR